MSEATISTRVWDAPTRLFHWGIVLLVCFSWFSQWIGWMSLHFLSGYTIMAALLFRLMWGVAGSDTARFSRFLKSPMAAIHHLMQLHRREPDTEIGHNAAGGWMVLLLLGLLCVQVATGLCANDDVAREGPLAAYVGKAWSDSLTRVHHLDFKLIEIAIVLHVLAVASYAVLKRRNLVWPMITGRKQLPPSVAAPRIAGSTLAVVLFLVAIGVVTLVVN